MSLAQKIPDRASVLVDTNPIIYVLAGHRLADRFADVFADIESGRIQGIITPITLAEIVSGPLSHGHEAQAERYRAALTAGPGWSLRPFDAEIAMLAARVRIRHRLKLPDAIQVATAIEQGCHALITHDRDFGRVGEVLVLG